MTGCIALSTPLFLCHFERTRRRRGSGEISNFLQLFSSAARKYFFQKQKFQNNEKIFQKEAIQKKQIKKPAPAEANTGLNSLCLR
jgi:hypothetical protein